MNNPITELMELPIEELIARRNRLANRATHLAKSGIEDIPEDLYKNISTRLDVFAVVIALAIESEGQGETRH